MVNTKSCGSWRRVALLSAAVACACALLASLVAGNANAAGITVAARPSDHVAAPHLKMPAPHLKMPAARSVRAVMRPNVAPWGTAVDFHNSYGTTVWVAIMRYDSDGCGSYGNWATKGWWRLDPGETKQAFSTSNEYAGYYAKAADGAQWSGNYGPVYVYHSTFDSCINIGSTAAYGTVGMRLIDLGGSAPWEWYSSYTVNITP